MFSAVLWFLVAWASHAHSKELRDFGYGVYGYDRGQAILINSYDLRTECVLISYDLTHNFAPHVNGSINEHCWKLDGKKFELNERAHSKANLNHEYNMNFTAQLGINTEEEYLVALKDVFHNGGTINYNLLKKFVKYGSTRENQGDEVHNMTHNPLVCEDENTRMVAEFCINLNQRRKNGTIYEVFHAGFYEHGKEEPDYYYFCVIQKYVFIYKNVGKVVLLDTCELKDGVWDCFGDEDHPLADIDTIGECDKKIWHKVRYGEYMDKKFFTHRLLLQDELYIVATNMEFMRIWEYTNDSTWRDHATRYVEQLPYPSLFALTIAPDRSFDFQLSTLSASKNMTSSTVQHLPITV